MQKLFVIKIGGNIIDDELKLASFLQDFADVQEPKILVHGGGKIATKIAAQLGIESKYVDGRRITDDATIDIVTMVYGGLVNKKIVAHLQGINCNAIGVTGADANLISATKRPIKNIDYGWVGDIHADSIKANLIQLLLQNRCTPVFAPLTHDGKGHILNTNADTIASSIAVALCALYKVRIVYCFEKKGVLENTEDETSVIADINPTKYHALREEGKLFAGMLPKIDNAFAALNAGVHEVLIGDAADLLENLTSQTIGTLIHL
jgi:acetylglutamate kinase